MKGRLLIAPGFDPYVNLALEALLTEAVQPGELLLYLWRNARTVVIGRNQNPYRECDRTLLEAEGGHLARRRSGGGAVYHDTGNLNFSFIARDGVYNESFQTQIVCRGVESLGIPCSFSGRNDLLAEGRKFSGAAYLHTNGTHCHHGTLMVAVQPEDMTRYLTPDPGKLAAKGVASVRARTINLSELRPGLTPETVQAALTRTFTDCCEGCTAFSLTPDMEERHRQLTRTFADPAWIAGDWEQAEETGKLSSRYPWGSITLRFSVQAGKIAGCTVETDAMDAGFFRGLGQRFTGLPADTGALMAALTDCPSPYREDLCTLLQGGSHGIL